MNWHQILQDVLEEHLRELTGMPVIERSREYQKRFRLDYYCELKTEGGSYQDETLRPFDHFKWFNVIEFKSYHQPLTFKMFVNYIGRACFVQSAGREERWGMVCLTLIVARIPRKFMDFCRFRGIGVKMVKPWLAKIEYAPGIDSYLLLLSRLRQVHSDGPVTYLQALESNPRFQHRVWQRLLDKETLYGKELKRIIMQIDKEGLMTYLESIKAEATQEIQARLEAVEAEKRAKQKALSEKQKVLKEKQAALKKEQLARKKSEAALAAAEQRVKDEQQRREALEAKLAELLGKNPGLAF